MARPRAFDEDQVIEKAMLAFWQHGYEATSIGKLETATEISRISIYNAFGDKTGLFLKALTKYSDSARDYFVSEAFRAGGLKSIAGLFEGAARTRPQDAPEHFGCLMLNTILDLESAGSEAKAVVTETRGEMVKGFKAAMEAALAAGDMRPVSPNEIQDRAEFLVGALWGGRMTVRLHGDVTVAGGVARTVVATVQSWKTNQQG